MILRESKNAIFPDTRKINPKFVDEVRAIVDKQLSAIDLSSEAVGSTYQPDPDKSPEEWSGDLDLQVELADVIKHFETAKISQDPKEQAKLARKALASYFEERGFKTAQAGVNVFVRVPFGENAYQVDLETIFKVKKIARYHQHKIPKGSPYKGVSKQLMLAMLAKQKGYVYSAWEGLYARTPDNKKGELVTDDWDEIAQALVGVPNGNAIDSVEAIVASLPAEQGKALLAQAQQDKNWVQKTPVPQIPSAPPVNEWFRNILSKI
jgi:hypothetical protein